MNRINDNPSTAQKITVCTLSALFLPEHLPINDRARPDGQPKQRSVVEAHQVRVESRATGHFKVLIDPVCKHARRKQENDEHVGAEKDEDDIGTERLVLFTCQLILDLVHL